MSKFLQILFILAIGILAEARKLTPIEIYKRCNIHLASLPISINGDIEKKILRAEADPIKECERILEMGYLKSDGRLAIDSKKSRAVLKTLTHFHRNWFEANTIEQVQGYNEETGRGSLDHYDPNEPALSITRALFNPAVQYKEVLTAPFGLVALREENQKIVQKYGFIPDPNGTKRDTPGRRVNGGMDSRRRVVFRNPEDHFEAFSSNRRPEDFAIPTTIKVGDLVGIIPRTEAVKATNIYLIPLDGNGQINAGHRIPGLDFKPDMYTSYGGGVLGTPVYFMMNSGHPYATRSNGTTKLPRRWVKNSMESFLCSTFPSLRESDIRPFFVGNSTTPFRNGKSCLQCHATMDRAATAARNLVIGATDYVNLVYPNPDKPSEILDSMTKYPIILARFNPQNAAQATWPSEPVENFHLQEPAGDFYFRSYRGLLVNRKVANIAELGQAFTETDDYYVCAAKRYFKYFTGVDVSLYDKTNPQFASFNRNLTNKDKEFRSFVENLGLQLKTHQSLPTMIKSIISSKYYKTSDPKSEDN